MDLNFLLIASALPGQTPQESERPLMERLWSRKETAKFLGVSLETLKNMEKRGETPPVIQVSLRRLMYRPQDWHDLLRSRERKPHGRNAPASRPATAEATA